MDKDRTDQKRDEETGHWVSDLKPGATHEAKVDKGVEDTFPASDPVQKAGATGFISPDGTDTAVHGSLAEHAAAGAAEALVQAGQAGGAATAVNQHPLPALLIAGTVGFVFGLLVNGKR
ncbi:hypothetical protein EAH89_24835 [Roseomonas nepalensis]|uniref:CsbD family protein n=1 Tax=Muricoccus nepalensis TaxID=1854500 RepID=A0A502FAP1_9PROT|nr:hypothetical protein [Roseomonas nepalensis]TPG46440.1 hypothetical protein EAH89_24835 [Roseomonas nepalensis]